MTAWYIVLGIGGALVAVSGLMAIWCLLAIWRDWDFDEDLFPLWGMGIGFAGGVITLVAAVGGSLTLT